MLGDVTTVSGVTLSEVNENDYFELKPDENPETPMNVYVTDQTFVSIGCDDFLDETAVQEGMEALVLGKTDASEEFHGCARWYCAPRRSSACCITSSR